MSEAKTKNQPISRQILVEQLVSHGLTIEAVQQFFTDFEVPDNHLYLRHVTRRLSLILSDYSPANIETNGILESHIKVANAILSILETPEAPELLEDNEDEVVEEEEASPSLQGLIGDHPFYSLLLLNATHPLHFNYFLGQFIHAYFPWRKLIRARHYLQDSGCRSARRIGLAKVRAGGKVQTTSELKTLPHILVALPSKPCTPDDYITAFEKERTVALNSDPIDIEIETIDIVLAILKKKIPDRKKSRKAKPQGKYVPRKLIPGSEIQTISVTQPDEPDIDLESEAGADPEECSTYTYQKIPNKEPVFDMADDRYRRISNTNRSSAFARANQALPLSTDNLNAYDIEHLCRFLDETINLPDSDTEALALLSILLAAGLPLDSLVNASTINKKDGPPVGGMGLTKDGQLIFSPWSGQSSQENTLESTSPKARELRIKLPQRVGEITNKWLNQAKITTGVNVFSSLHPELIKRSETLLKSLNESLGTRLSLTRVEGFLYRALCQLPGSDPTVAISITGQTTNYGHSPAYYNGWLVQQLSVFYASHLAHLKEWASISPEWLNGYLVQDEMPDAMAGSQLTPTRKTISEFARKNRALMRAASNDPPGHISFIAKHNLYISGLYSYLEFSLGARAVSHLILHPNCINLELGLIYLSDKDNHNYSHGRFCFLPQPVIQAFHDLNDHLNALLSHLIHLNTDSAMRIQWLNHPKPNGNRHRDLENWKSNPPLLFSLNATGQISPLKPGQCMASWKKSTGLPPNSPRHAFRTYSRHGGNPDAIVRSAMGHWQTGTEPVGRFSTLSPAKIKQFAHGWMTKQLRIDKQLAWNPPVSPLLK